MLKRILLTVISSLGLLMPAALPAVAHAQDTNIGGSLTCGANLEFGNPDGCTESGAPSDEVDSLISTVINVLSVVVGVVAVIMIIIGGFRYVLSGGNDSSIQGAKNTILYAIIGLVIVAVAQVIVRFVLDRATS